VKETLPQGRIRSTIWVIFFVALGLGLSSCSVGHPSPSFTSTPTTEFVLAPGTYQVVGRFEGYASCPFLFWIDIPDLWEQSSFGVRIPLLSFALGDPNLRSRALADLHTKVEIQGKRRVLHNIMEETTVANYLGLFAIYEVTVSAEVIEFTGSQS